MPGPGSACSRPTCRPSRTRRCRAASRSEHMPPVPQLEPAAAQALLQERGQEAVLLDVREPSEYALVHVEGARHIPMAQVPVRLGELDPGHTYVIMCHHGLL